MARGGSSLNCLLTHRPVGMIVLFSIVLYLNRADFAAGRATTPITKAVRFLTGGYRKKFFYWEMIELFRRLAISGWVRA